MSEQTRVANRGVRHRGPNLVAVAVVFTALFLTSLIATAVAAGGGHFPSPFAPAGPSMAWFRAHPGAVLAGAFFQFGAAIPLGIFTATAVSRVRFLGVNVAGVLIALFGGLAASVFLALSALAQWTLSQPGVVESEATARALHAMAFATGGPGHVVPLGLLVAGLSLSAGLTRLLPRWLMWFGLVVAAVAELSTLSLVLPAAAYLLPLARFPAFAWIICAGALLPASRPSGDASGGAP